MDEEKILGKTIHAKTLPLLTKETIWQRRSHHTRSSTPLCPQRVPRSQESEGTETRETILESQIW